VKQESKELVDYIFCYSFFKQGQWQYCSLLVELVGVPYRIKSGKRTIGGSA